MSIARRSSRLLRTASSSGSAHSPKWQPRSAPAAATRANPAPLRGMLFTPWRRRRCLEHVGLELGCLSSTQLVALMEFDLGRISSALGTPNGGADSLHLLPKCLNLLVTIEACSIPLADGSTARDGAGIVSYALRSILAASWPPAGLLRLAMSLRELEVPKAGLKPHLAKMLRHLSEIEMAQLPVRARTCHPVISRQPVCGPAAEREPPPSPRAGHDVPAAPAGGCREQDDGAARAHPSL